MCHLFWNIWWSKVRQTGALTLDHHKTNAIYSPPVTSCNQIFEYDMPDHHQAKASYAGKNFWKNIIWFCNCAGYSFGNLSLMWGGLKFSYLGMCFLPITLNKKKFLGNIMGLGVPSQDNKVWKLLIIVSAIFKASLIFQNFSFMKTRCVKYKMS